MKNPMQAQSKILVRACFPEVYARAEHENKANADDDARNDPRPVSLNGNRRRVRTRWESCFL
jgi:hypothetical protein